MSRLDHAHVLLEEIDDVIATIEPGRRDHAADLLNAAIELLTRLRTRLPPDEPEPPAPDPPY